MDRAEAGLDSPGPFGERLWRSSVEPMDGVGGVDSLWYIDANDAPNG